MKTVSFKELVYRYSHCDTPSPKLEEKILDVLVPKVQGIEYYNDVLNIFGDMAVEPCYMVDQKVRLCRALTIFANYDIFSCNVYTKEKSYYRDIIFDVFKTSFETKTRKETYAILRDFV